MRRNTNIYSNSHETRLAESLTSRYGEAQTHALGVIPTVRAGKRSFFCQPKRLSSGRSGTIRRESMRFVSLAIRILGLALVFTGPLENCIALERPFGRNHDCVCAELQGYLDYLNRAPLKLVNSPVPQKYRQRLLARKCRTTISPSAYERMMVAIRAYVYYCSQASQNECLVSRRAMREVCPRMEIGFSVPPPPGTRADCYYACKANCPRARDPQGDWGDLAIDPRCLQDCNERCKRAFER